MSGERVQRVGHQSIESGTLECKEWDKRVINLVRNVSGTFMVNNFEKPLLGGVSGMYFASFQTTSYLRCIFPLRYKILNDLYTGCLIKSGIRKSVKLCVIAPELWVLHENNLCPQKIEFIAVILSIIDFLSSKGCPRYQYDFLH